MAPYAFHGVELLPGHLIPSQLFILLHDARGRAADLMPFAHQLRKTYPDAAFIIPDGTLACDEHDGGRQWYPIYGITEENLPERVAQAMPALYAMVRQAQERLKVLPTDTALLGFSQGATMALEFSAMHDGGVGRVVAISGRYARLPAQAAELTTVHLLHGAEDAIVPVAHAYSAYERLSALQADVTLDVASSIGHELHAVLLQRAIYRLQTCIPLRSWKRALGGN